jgi:hypothetical protein
VKAVIVYESMFGNTVVAVHGATPEVVEEADVVIVGAPTHIHGLPGRRSRQGATAAAAKEGSDLVLEPHHTEPGLREWFSQLGPGDGRFAAAFDTRATGPAFLTGRASRGLARRLRHHRFHVGAVKSFGVVGNGQLVDGEVERAGLWGESVASVAAVGLREQPRSSAV